MKHLYAVLASLLIACAMQAQHLTQEAPFFSGELIVRLHDNEMIDLVLEDFRVANGQPSDIAVIRQLSEPMRIWHLRFNDSVIANYDMLKAVRNHRAVELAQFNHEVTQRSTIPNDPQFGQQWHHLNPNGSDIDSDLAWDITTGGLTAFGDEIVVCVIEGGNLNHPDLVDNKWVNVNEIPGNGIDDDGNGYVDDYNGWNVANQSDAGVFSGNHGTQVMGMIGAKGNNDLGVAGVNWDVKIMSVAGESLFNEASVVAAYNYPLVMRNLYHSSGGELGAFVVATNASWGIDNANPDNHPLWCAVYDDLGEAGILNCGATANNNVNIDVVGNMPTACPSPYMVAVTATNNNDVRTFAGYGVNTIDLAAPGEAVFTTSGQSGYGSTSGTSFASPLTAGAIALIYSTPCPSFAALVHADPQAAADYVYEVIMAGCDPIPNLANEVISGGRLNVHNSIQLILQQCSDSDCFTPFGVNLSGNVVDGFALIWGGTPIMESFNVRYRAVGDENWIEINDLDTTAYDLLELPWCTGFEVQVMAICGEDEESAWSNPQTWLTNGCCEHPETSTFEIDNVTETGATFSWGSILAAESYNVTMTDENGVSETFSNIVNTSFGFSGLEPCTMYTISLGVNCEDEELEPIMAGSFITFGCGACADADFCPSSGGTQDEWIQRVQFVDLDNNSGNDGGYGDFTMHSNLTTSLDPGGNYEVILTPGYSGPAYNELWRVWIDLNQNGTFEENEIVFTSSSPSNSAVTATINIPVTAVEGPARMRVSMKYAGFFGNASPPAACETMEFGEVEDYCVEITDNVICDGSELTAGCTNPAACNFDPIADCDDSSCTFPGCNDPSACTYDAQAGCNDGSCLYNDPCGICGGSSIAGCTNPLACNYDSQAACDDDSCTFPGCTDNGSVNYDPLAGCDDGSCIPTFGSFVINAPASMLYSDTLEIEVMVTGGQNLYGLFATLQYNTQRFAFVGSTLGDYLGVDVLASPPVDAGGSIEFGASKLGQQPGSNGDGWFYTLRFVPISPNLGNPVFVDFSLTASDAFNALGTSGQLFLPETHTVELIFEAEVWPGDLNHDGVVSVADILPIGYFYNITGPARPNASLTWEGQNCPIWGTGASFPGDGFYRVFADGNGDGVINLADQVAVGFNINQTVSLDVAPPNYELLALAQSTGMVVPISNEVSPDLVSIPETGSITVVFTATTTAANAESLFGFTMSIDLASLGILASDAEVDFSVSEFGVLNQTMIAQAYGQGNQLDLAITRTSPNSSIGNIVLCAITLPLPAMLSAGNYNLPVTIGAANDPTGQTALLSAQNIQFTVNSPFGCTDNAACNYTPGATQDDGSCLFVGDDCDDGNPETINDVITTDCECAGETIEDGVFGCTDADACNYNPQATQDDGSCEYVQLYAIQGPVGPEAFSTVPYTYPSSTGSTYAWSVNNGVLASGQGTAEVEVIWSSQGSGTVSVTETDDTNCSGATVTLDVVVLPTNINELALQSISIYPNPAQTWFRVDLPENFAGGHIELFSLTGQLVATTQLVARSQQVDVSHLTNGMYIIHVHLPSGRSEQRLSVAR